MRAVTQAEFFAALKADPADIMPSVLHSPDYTVWEDTRTRKVFGRTYPGWKNPGEAKCYLLELNGGR